MKVEIRAGTFDNGHPGLEITWRPIPSIPTPFQAYLNLLTGNLEEDNNEDGFSTPCSVGHIIEVGE